MVSGSVVYRHIKEKISELESDLDSLGNEINVCENSITKGMEERENCYGALATFYLPELDATSMQKTIKEVQDEVKMIFRQKQTRRTELEATMNSSQSDKKRFEAELDEVTEKLNGKVAERERLSKIVAIELSKNKSYTDTRTQAVEIDKQLTDYKKKVKEIEQDATERLPAYEENKLFSYLLGKNFGSPNYEGHGLVARLDAWVARIVNFDEEKQSYDFLHSVPEIINEEVRKKQKDLEKLAKGLQKVETEVSDKTGFAQIIKEGTTLGEYREKLLEHIELLTLTYSASERERRGFDSTKDSYHAEAINRLKAYLKGATIEDLKRKALTTTDKIDDNLIDQIEEIDLNIKTFKKKANGLKTRRNSIEEKLEGLNSIKQKYSHSDFESGSSSFGSGFDINLLLVAYLMGKTSQSDLWNDIQHHQDFERESSYSHSSYSSHSSSPSFDSFSSGGGFGGGGGFSSGSGF
jgi:chromosome segregation ATPase